MAYSKKQEVFGHYLLSRIGFTSVDTREMYLGILNEYLSKWQEFIFIVGKTKRK